MFSDRPTFVSLNRFEAKKNVELALKGFTALKPRSLTDDATVEDMRLVIAGGYDEAVPDNVATLRSLRQACDQFDLSHETTSAASSAPIHSSTQVVFILNFTQAQRTYLLTNPHTIALLYTPTNEHFGIVPIEAGACGIPVLAVNAGGPTETIVDGETGLLRPAVTDAWAEAMTELMSMPDERRKDMAKSAKQRVSSMFSLATLGEQLEEAAREAMEKGDLHDQMGDRLIWGGLAIMGISGVAIAITIALTG